MEKTFIEKIDLLKSIPICEVRDCLPKLSNTTFNILARKLNGLDYYNTTLYDALILDEEEIRNIFNIGEKRFYELNEFLKTVKNLKYEEIINIYNDLHKYNNLSVIELVDVLHKIIYKDESVLIGSDIVVNNLVLWKIFLQKLQGKCYDEICNEIGIDKKIIFKILSKIKTFQKKQNINKFLTLLIQNIKKEHYVVNYIYTYKEIELKFGDEVVLLLRYEEFLNNGFYNSSFFDYDLESMLNHVRNDDIQNLLSEIDENCFLSKQDKKFFINKLKNWMQHYEKLNSQ